MMKTERKRKMMNAGAVKGTKPRLTHSKFSINTAKDFDDGYTPQTEFVPPTGSGNAFKMSETQKGATRRTKPETSPSTELKSSSSGAIFKKRSLRKLSPSARAESATEDEPGLKHHLEQVFIKPPLNKRD